MAVGGALRTVALTVTANVGAFVGNLGTAAAASTAFANKHAASMTTAGAATAAFGAAAVGGLLLSAREAINWESAWAGVTKTVDGSTSQMAELEDELRSMAKTLPASHKEIAAVAEAAGQLGIKREDVAGFTKTMIDLGVSTNLTADQAATALARFSNIMGTSASDVDRLGASLVALGNDGASTEGEIVTMALRIAGAGRSIGLSEGDVLAYANALSSLGIEAEAGGTAISTVFLKVQSAVDEGGDSLTEFARVAGVSAEDFSQKFGTDAAGAMQLFIEGLGNADKAGENTTGIMADLGLKGIRVTDTLRRLAGNSELVADSVELGNRAFRENTALVEEANKRYETTASKLAVARNNLRDTAITIGDNLLPAIQGAADGFANLAEFVGDIPAPLLTMLTNITGVIGGLALLAGGLLIVIPQIAQTVVAMQALAKAAPAAAAGVRALAIAGGIAAGVLILAAAVGAITDANREAAPTFETVRAEMIKLQSATDISNIDALFSGLDTGAFKVKGFADAINSLDNSKLESVGEGINRIFTTTGDEKVLETLNQMSEVMAQLVASGDAEKAAEQFALMNAELGGTDESAARLMELMPAYAEALKAADNAAAETAGSTETLAREQVGLQKTTDELNDSMKLFSSILDDIFSQAFSVGEATDRFQESLNGLAQAAKDNGTALTGTSDAAIANRDAFRGLVDEARAVIDAMIENGASQEDVAATSALLRDQLNKTADEAGYAAGEVGEFSGVLDEIPGAYVATIGVTGTESAAAKLDNVRVAVDRLDGRTATVNVRYTSSGNVSNVVSRTGVDLPQADGGVVDYYADGGVRENHVAQIAPAGAWRVWAEPETEGEAYIPLAPAKRGRSVAIAQEVAERFGYQMVPRQPVAYQANGGVYGARSAAAATVPSGPSVALSGTFYSYDPTALLTAAQKKARDAAAVAGLTTMGV